MAGSPGQLGPETHGPFGDPLFPDAKADLTLDGFVRYVTNAAFADVVAFFERQFKDEKYIFTAKSEEKGVPTWVAGAGVRYTAAAWAALLVTPVPPKGKKPGKGTHIVVTKKG